MARLLHIKKKQWTKGELLSELKKRGDNAFARSAIDYEFISLTTRNAVGEVVYDCETEVTAYSVLMNIQASYMEKFILSFLTNHGCDLEKFWQEKENYSEMHRLITGMFAGMYEVRR